MNECARTDVQAAEQDVTVVQANTGEIVVRHGPQFFGDAPGQPVLGQVQDLQVVEVGQPGRYLPGKLVLFEAQVLQGYPNE